MGNYDRYKENICREIDEIFNEGQLSIECIHVLGEMFDIIKDIAETEEKEAIVESYNVDGGYSQRGRMMPRYYEGNSYGNSYGGSSYYGRGRNYNGYSRDDGKRDLVSKLEAMWNEAKNDQERDMIKRWLDQAQNK